MDWFRWYGLKFERKTVHLTAQQDGVYRRLIDRYMLMFRGPLPDDDRQLALLARVELQEWLDVAPAVRPFFRARGGMLHQKTCDEELAHQSQRHEMLSERGKKASFARWSKPNGIDARRMQDAMHTDARGDKNKTLTSSASEPEPAREAPATRPEEGGRRTEYAVSPELARNLRRRNWTP